MRIRGGGQLYDGGRSANWGPDTILRKRTHRLPFGGLFPFCFVRNTRLLRIVRVKNQANVDEVIQRSYEVNELHEKST